MMTEMELTKDLARFWLDQLDNAIDCGDDPTAVKALRELASLCNKLATHLGIKGAL